MKSTIFLCWAGSSIKSVPRTYSANFAGSEASSGAMSPSVETARLRADDRAGQEEMRCNASDHVRHKDVWQSISPLYPATFV